MRWLVRKSPSVTHRLLKNRTTIETGARERQWHSHRILQKRTLPLLTGSGTCFNLLDSTDTQRCTSLFKHQVCIIGAPPSRDEEVTRMKATSTQRYLKLISVATDTCMQVSFSLLLQFFQDGFKASLPYKACVFCFEEFKPFISWWRVEHRCQTRTVVQGGTKIVEHLW
jgi:hypothetical protein